MTFKYFAYGSCMSFNSLIHTFGNNEFKFTGAAILRDYSVLFNYPSTGHDFNYLNISKKPGAIVHGGLFDIPGILLEKLDAREGLLNNRYERTDIQVDKYNNKGTVECFTYSALITTNHELFCGDRYAQIVVDGIDDCNIDSRYADCMRANIKTLKDNYDAR